MKAYITQMLDDDKVISSEFKTQTRNWKQNYIHHLKIHNLYSDQKLSIIEEMPDNYLNALKQFYDGRQYALSIIVIES